MDLKPGDLLANPDMCIHPKWSSVCAHKTPFVFLRALSDGSAVVKQNGFIRVLRPYEIRPFKKE